MARGRIVADGPPDEVLSDDRIRDVFEVDPAFLRRSGGQTLAASVDEAAGSR
jgi:ABC-type cobalamin/Fe3+-siderophores transport system ATPase subunit